MFDSPDSPGSGIKFMEREPVLLLDRAIHAMQRKSFTAIELAYATPAYADRLGLVSFDSHRIGKAIRLRVTNPKKKYKLVQALMNEGAHRIGVSHSKPIVYFDTDELKEYGLFVWY
jgi:hypothetical protein